MAGRFDDDDDWVGTPPEGRISRDRADPDYWRRRAWPIQAIFFGPLAVLIIVLVILIVTR